MDLDALEQLVRRVMREELEKLSSASPVLMTREQAAKALNIGKTKLQELVSSGALLVIRVGTRTLIPVDEVKRFASPKPESLAKHRSAKINKASLEDGRRKVLEALKR